MRWAALMRLFFFGVTALAGLLAARLVNVFVAGVLRVERSVPDVAAPIAGRSSDVDTSIFASRNLFAAMREVVIEEDPPPLSRSCERSSLNARLVATVVSIDPDRSVAVFGADEAYYRGDLLMDRAKIVQIGSREVRVDHEGRCETFTFDEEVAPQLAAAVVIEESSTRIIPRSELDAALADLNRMATDARIVPFVKDGVPQGFRLFSIRPGSLYTRLGLQNADVIQRVNNHDLSDPAVAYETYLKLKDASTISVDLIRSGQPVTLRFELR